MKESKTNIYRYDGIDLLRIIGVASIIVTHYMERSGFYDKAIDIQSIWGILGNWFGRICIPLYLIISGYCLSKRDLTREHIFKLGSTLFQYGWISFVTGIIFHFMLGFSFAEIVVSTIDFTLIPYAWYIELYVGLYLVAPFLNTVIDRKQLGLMAILFVITVLPVSVNWLFSRFGFNSFIPEIWEQALYPFLYYTIGGR